MIVQHCLLRVPDLRLALLHARDGHLHRPLDQLPRLVLHPVHRRLARLEAALQERRTRVL